ncbi:H+/Ca2+ exchanger Vxc1-like protein [Lactarius tabidus]
MSSPPTIAISDEEAVTYTTPVNSGTRIWQRFSGKTRRRVGWGESAKAIICVSWTNSWLIFIPISWLSRFRHWEHGQTFAFCFLALVPLEKLFDFGGEQLSMYCGEDLGDLIVVTLNNTVEATLAIILLFRCELKLLQSTIIGVVLLHLLLVPGTAFFTGGARILEQQLHPQRSQLNHTLLTVGWVKYPRRGRVLALTIPVAFFAAMDDSNNDGAEGVQGPSDTLRADFLGMSRGFSVILLVIYIGSRFYLHDPPGKNNAFTSHPDISPELLRREKELEEAEPDVNPWACVILLVTCVALAGVTAVFLVESIEYVRGRGNIKEEWFGIVLLPIVSFSADATVAITYFVRQSLKVYLGFRSPLPPESLAQARAIDMSIQFLLFWTPFLTLLGWWTNKPMTLLFDLFEVTLLVGACFLVNYVTADGKTNWAEGSILIAFYAMIVVSAWYYPGQNEVRVMDSCTSIASALINGVTDEQ